MDFDGFVSMKNREFVAMLVFLSEGNYKYSYPL